MNIFEIFLDSSRVVQLVMLLLVAMSIASWGIIIWKTKIIASEKKRLVTAKMHIGTMDFKQMNDGSIGSHIVNYIKKTNALYTTCRSRNEMTDAKNHAEDLMESMLYTYNHNIRRGSSTLATIAGIAPYIGLFGTVCGILVSFQGLADAKVVTLQTVAPGIIEALITTAIGLVTAVPALIGANAVTRLCNSIVGDLSQTKAQIITSLHKGHEKKMGGVA